MANKSYKDQIALHSGTGAAAGGQTTSNQMLELILNRKPHSYDAKNDPAAQAARKQAARNAQAATRDTLGQHAGLTGGVPSTAAVSAAAQAGNAALAQGADRVAELEQMSWQRYQQEGQDLYDAYGMLRGQEQDAREQERYDQQWQYQQGRDQVADQRYQEEQAYQKEQDAYNREWNEQQRDYSREQAEYEKRLAMAQLRAAYGDLGGLKELGVDTSKYQSGGSGNPGSYRNPGGIDKSGDPVDPGDPGLLTEEQNNEALAYLLSRYHDMTMSQSEWAEEEARYGEANLKAWGFRKKASTGGGTGGPGAGDRPGSRGNNRVNLMN